MIPTDPLAPRPRTRPEVPRGYQPCIAGHDAPEGPPTPELARRDEARTGLYHLWKPPYGMRIDPCPRWRKCRPLAEQLLGQPVAAALVPTSQRCGHAGWPLYIPRPWAGPLPYNWNADKILRWYVWWRLFDLQGGRCATCPDSPATIDHDHRTRAVRGLLCVSCNRLETDYFHRKRLCVHAPPHCFEQYWRAPPALPFRWTMASPASFRHAG